MKNKREQRRFVKELCASIEKKVLDHIKLGRIPTEWDGIELRELVADIADRSRAGKDTIGRKRLGDYRNTVIINNL